VEAFRNTTSKPLTYKSDLSGVSAFQVLKRGDDYLSGSPPTLPPGWRLEVYMSDGEGEYTFDPATMALGVSACTEPHCSQVTFRSESPLLEFQPNRTYEVRAEVKAAPDLSAFLAVQTLKDFRSIASENIAAGDWVVVKLRFKLEGTQVPQIVFSPTAPARGKFVYIRSLEIEEVN
jgi:hypothetical protein